MRIPHAKLIILPFIVSVLLCSFACGDEVYGDFTYTISEGSVTITGYTGAGGEVAIPVEIESLPVKVIGNEAFLEKAEITAILIPEGITHIGDLAFAGVMWIRELVLPDTLETIGSRAFERLLYASTVSFGSGLKKIGPGAFGYIGTRWITLPEGLEEIGDNAFGGSFEIRQVTIPSTVTKLGEGIVLNCSRLEIIEVSEDNQHFASHNGVLFNKDYTRLLAYPSGRYSNTYTVPEGVTDIGPKAFFRTLSLKYLNLPSSLKRIKDFAFFRCGSLRPMELPDGLVEIGPFAFGNCSAFESMTVPDTVAIIGENAFTDCGRLRELIFMGDRPFAPDNILESSEYCTVFYMLGSNGWDSLFANRTPILYSAGIWVGADKVFLQDWLWLDWFGRFHMSTHGWTYQENIEWLYPAGDDSSGFHFFDQNAQTWNWTSDRVFPYIYQFAPQSQWILLSNRP